VLSQFVAPAFLKIKNHSKMTKHTKKLTTQPTSINTTLEVLQSDLSAFFGAAMLNHSEDSFTYKVCNLTYNDIHDWVRVLITSQPTLQSCIEIEYDEICGDYFFEIVYSRMVSMAGGFDEVRIRIENLDMMYAEETMYKTIEGCRPVSERLYF
jgi:hypothetical protein